MIILNDIKRNLRLIISRLVMYVCIPISGHNVWHLIIIVMVILYFRKMVT